MLSLTNDYADMLWNTKNTLATMLQSLISAFQMYHLPLQPVKTWVAYILTFYILFSAVVPCSMIDNCGEECTEQTSDSDHKKDCNNCSPFSICASASGFTLNSISTSLELITFKNSPTHSEYYFSSKSEYYSSLFQPPRLD